MATHVSVRSLTEEKARKFCLVEGRLPLQSLKGCYPDATGLIHKIDQDNELILPIVNGAILPPEGGWEVVEYTPLTRAEIKTEPPHTESPSEELLRALVAKPSQVVMAPERKLPVFEGRDDEKSVPVDDFVTAMNHAYERYHITEDQRGQFLLDSLRGGPKVEVRSLLSSGKTTKEALKYLTTSYGETLTSGELQRRCLERRQQRGESIRQFGVELQRLFQRLFKRDPGLYKDPDTIIREQFVDGIEQEGLRHSCRDFVDRNPSISFGEVKDWAIKREERERARAQTTAFQSTSSAMEAGMKPDAIQRLEKQMQEIMVSVKSLAERIPPAERLPTPISPQALLAQPGGRPPRPWWHQTDYPNFPKPRAVDNPYTAPVQSTPRCFRCGQPGHFARNCLNSARPRPNPPPPSPLGAMGPSGN
ncbi:uncharacterized protein LOC119733081 [Patiria miniata]|uniref:CCHC-type domain-containing protein n=1 Tax=Patiria miniata TaxID=46514 RepID=A0A914AGS3_PATMI|nr:uncharacterized protein LOC119733081 [Patiria miniata]